MELREIMSAHALFAGSRATISLGRWICQRYSAVNCNFHKRECLFRRGHETFTLYFFDILLEVITGL
jgi:hypothetical protein